MIFSAVLTTLQRFLLRGPGAAKPDGDTAAQHALTGASVESGEDGRGEVCSPHQVQEI